MAAGLKVEGLSDLRSDLRKIDRALPRELNKELRGAIGPVIAAAKVRAPRSHIQKSPTRHLAGSLKPFVSGSTVGVRSRLPYAKIVHWGGRRPFDTRNRGDWRPVVGRPFIAQAAAGREQQTMDGLGDAIERLIARHGFK